MNKMPDVLIGVPTYNTISRADFCLESIRNVTKYDGNIDLVLLDDGSPVDSQRERAMLAANTYNARFIQHDKNEGIPKSWNDLSRSGSSEYIVLLNDDIGILNPHWLTILIEFIRTNTENGIKIGPVGLPTVNSDPITGRIFYKDNGTGDPGLCGAPTGCCFGFSRKLFDEIGGFWDELISFYEETTFGVESTIRGYMPVQLGGPLMAHHHSQTFALNSELSEAHIEDEMMARVLHSPMTMRRYNEYVAQCHEQGVHCVIYPDWVKERLCGRMGRARVMFATRYGCEDMIDKPQNETHARFVSPLEDTWYSAPLQWLVSDGVSITIKKRD